jgi:hypothetical protein
VIMGSKPLHYLLAWELIYIWLLWRFISFQEQASRSEGLWFERVSKILIMRETGQAIFNVEYYDNVECNEFKSY